MRSYVVVVRFMYTDFNVTLDTLHATPARIVRRCDLRPTIRSGFIFFGFLSESPEPAPTGDR